MNNKNTHSYIQVASNVVFMYIQDKKGIKLFGSRDIEKMIKEFRQYMREQYQESRWLFH